jgi:hypothetical protein
MKFSNQWFENRKLENKSNQKLDLWQNQNQ